MNEPWLMNQDWVNGQPKHCRDPYGNEYHSLSEMCRAYHTSRDAFIKRVKEGMNWKEALEYSWKYSCPPVKMQELYNEQIRRSERIKSIEIDLSLCIKGLKQLDILHASYFGGYKHWI